MKDLDETKAPLLDHLVELRKRLLVCVAFIIVAFFVALMVIKWFVGLVSRQGFTPFAWYRIAAGIGALLWLSLR